MSGYTSCPCRDCFEISFGDQLCSDCLDSGCCADGSAECASDCAYGGCFDPSCCDSEAA